MKTILLAATMALLLVSCKKNDALIPGNQVADNTATKVTDWLDLQVNRTSSADSKERMKNLKQHLVLDQLHYEDLRKGEKLIIVPIDNSFVPGSNKNENPINCLMLVETTEGTIRKGNIVQYIPVVRTTENKIPANAFHEFFTSQNLADAKFTFLTLTNKFMYEMEYKDQTLSKHRTLYDKNKKEPSLTKEETCIDWYLQTFENGILVSEVYVYTTCGPYVEDGSGSGVGGGENPTGTVVKTQATWAVAANVSGFWILWSTEEFTGVKVPGEIGGGHFTSVTHSFDAISNFLPNYAYIWQRWGSTQSFTVVDATVSIFGQVISPELVSVVVPPKYKTWMFPILFP